MSPELIKKLRARLGITQAELAVLIGVTGPAVAQWEGGTSEPRGANRAIIVGFRKLGRRDVQVLLESRGMGARRIQRTSRETSRKKK
jgi:transcriptional regulator with XRE-family HTH domain